MRIKDLPEGSRPREKALSSGLNSLSNQELLALLIVSGTPKRSALEVAASLLGSYHGLRQIASLPPPSLASFEGIGTKKALTLSACFELGKRMASEELSSYPQPEPKLIAKSYMARMGDERRERLLLLMYSKNRVLIGEKCLYEGSGDALPFKAQEVIREVLIHGAGSYIIIHNHPSGSPLPSEADVAATLALEKQSREFHIRLIDHLIIGLDDYYSFLESGLVRQR